MRRLIAAALGCAALVAATSCRRQEPTVEEVQEQPPELTSVVQVADPAASVQLLSGFYDVEQNAWRWTKGQFSVTLKTPEGAAQKGATLELKFAVPDPVIAKVGPTTLTATVDGTALPPETYPAPGDKVFTRDVPASALGKNAVDVEFTLDKFLKAGEVEHRELGVIVTSISLLPK